MKTGALKVDHTGSHGTFNSSFPVKMMENLHLADTYLCAKNEDPSSVIFFVLTSP